MKRWRRINGNLVMAWMFGFIVGTLAGAFIYRVFDLIKLYLILHIG